MQASRKQAKSLITALGLLAFAFLLLWFLYLADQKLQLRQNPSGRYRVHAIPVALSQMYHGRPHDFTAWKGLAYLFRQADEPLDVMLGKYTDPGTPVGDDIYFWTADDRGLSDYVRLAFWIFGPATASLSHLWYVLLAVSMLLFFLAHYREPRYFLAPIFILIGLLLYAHACPFRDRITMGDGTVWGEQIALYESRTFDALGLLAWFHLAILAWRGRRPEVMTCATALLQAMLLVFLYHARSSLGWMYLSLLVLALTAIAPPLWRRLRGVQLDAAMTGPVLVTGLLLGSLAGLHVYKQACYHPRYNEDPGSRTFWHNALMGFGYHPRLRESMDIGVDDAKIILFVIKRMREEGDPRIDENWTHEHIGMSLAAHTRFDWRVYEAAARDIYVNIWRRQTGAAIACYAWYKPWDILRYTWQAAKHVSGEIGKGRANLLVAALVGAAGVLFLMGWGMFRDSDARAWVRLNLSLCLWLLCFSLIPSIAFYAALTTLAAFYTALPLFVSLAALYLGTLLGGWRRPTNVADAASKVTESDQSMIHTQPTEAAGNFSRRR